MAIMGNSLQLCEYLKGVRFVDTTVKYNQRMRVEIWVNYRDDQFDLLQTHCNEISAFLEKDCGFPEVKTLKFYNIDREEKKLDKPQKTEKQTSQ